MSIAHLVSTFVTLFVIIDPLSIAPLFISLTADRSDAEHRSIAVRAILIAGLVLVLFALAGHVALSAMGISLPAFRIAGGILLFWISFEMVFEKQQERQCKTAEVSKAEEAPPDVAAFPLGVPLIAGPGAVTAVILLAGKATESPQAWLLLASVIAVVLVVLAINLAVMLAAVPINRFLGATVRNVVTRLLGVILAALSVQFVVDGARTLVSG